MLHVLLVLLVLTVLMRDNLAREYPDAPIPAFAGAPVWMVVGCSLLLYALPAIILLLPIRELGRGLDRSGRIGLVRLADRLCLGVRWGALASHVIAIFFLGWLDAVRTIVGNLILLDELIALLPPLAVIAASWWAMYPIDRRLREATVMAALDSGHHMPRLVTRRQFVMERIRHDMALVVVPISLMIGWWESTERIVSWLAARNGAWTQSGWWEWGIAGVQFGGALVILACMPLVLVRVWRTIPLGPGEMRDRLEEMCRAHRVRVRKILVWRTHDAIINGALVGVLPFARYILLTETLLERLSQDEVEAVMAHEVGHAQRHHLIWLVLSIVAAVSVASIVMDWLLRGLFQARVISPGVGSGGVWMWLASLGTLVAAVWAFGHVSRRFEQQADAFAAQHLSGQRWGGDSEGGSIRVTPEAAGSMARALGSVALHNRMDPNRFTFRHGSIRGRQRRLSRLIGQPAHALPIDRRVRWIKVLALVALVGVLVYLILEWREMV